MKFLTYYSEMAQTEKPGIWYTLHNQLFIDKNNTISLVPRFFSSDSYTIPDWLAWLGGGKMKWDNRPSLEHDLNCKYHSFIKVNLTKNELIQKGYLHTKIKSSGSKNIMICVCEDIPIEYLSVEKINFNQVNGRFKRMMQATNNLKIWRINMMRFAVNFNIGWLFSGKIKLDLNKLYKDFI